MLYRVKWDYVGVCGKYPKDKVLELDDDTAALMNRDSWGCLELVPEPEIEPASELPPELEEVRAYYSPPSDRQIKKPRRSRKA